LIGLGMLLYAAAPGYAVVALALALMGIGGGLKEALINPLVQELHPNDSGKFLNSLNGFWSIGVLLTMLLGGELLTQGASWRWIAAALGALSLLSGALFLSFRRHHPTPPVRGLGTVMQDKLRILRSPRFWVFWTMMFLAGGIEGAYTFWTASYFQIELGSLPRASGIGAACFAAGMIARRFAAAAWVKQHQLFPLLLGSALLGLLTGLLVPLIQSATPLFAALFVMGLVLACFWPTIQAYAAERLPVEPTALFILLSCGGIPGFATLSWLVGWIGDTHGPRAAFVVLPAVFVPLILCFVWERSRPAAN